MSFYRRNLPHWQPPEAQYFITFRLAGSLPKEATHKIKSQYKEIEQKYSNISQNLSQKINRRIFQKYESLLENNNSGPFWLRKPKVAKLVCNAIEYRDSKKYNLYSYCIMPNHVHLVFKLLKTAHEIDNPVTKILSSLKQFTTREADKILNRKGQFWQHESFDRVIRDQKELESTIRYVLNNPVKANFVDTWTEWPYNYLKTKFKNDF